jgi:hypothetical protein
MLLFDERNKKDIALAIYNTLLWGQKTIMGLYGSSGGT